MQSVVDPGAALSRSAPGGLRREREGADGWRGNFNSFREPSRSQPRIIPPDVARPPPAAATPTRDGREW